MTLLGHAIAVVTASEVVSSRGLIACARAAVGDTRYALFILWELSGTTCIVARLIVWPFIDIEV